MSMRMIIHQGFIYRKAAVADLPQYLYHVTFIRNLEDIEDRGLRPEYGGSLFGGGYAGHSKGHVFLTEEDGLLFWFRKIGDMAEYRFEEPIEAGAVPVAIRIPSQYLPELEIDKAGSKDAFSDAFQTTVLVDPDHMEVWFDGAWHPLSEVDSEDLQQLALDGADYDEMDEPDPPEDPLNLTEEELREWDEYYENEGKYVIPNMDVFLP